MSSNDTGNGPVPKVLLILAIATCGLNLVGWPGGTQGGGRDSVASLDSGPAIGSENPAFDPQHVWGPDKGSHACPMCKYGYIQGVLYWINSDRHWDEVRTMAAFLERQSVARGDRRFKAYLLYMNPGMEPIRNVEKKLTDLSLELNLKRMAVTYVPSPTDRNTVVLNRINPAARNTVIVYRKRKVLDKFVDFEPTESNLKLLAAALDRAEQGR